MPMIQTINAKDESVRAAARKDVWAQVLLSRAVKGWYAPLWSVGWNLPFYLVMDLGMLLLKADTRLESGSHVTQDYVAMLREISNSRVFRQCASVISSADPLMCDEAVIAAIRCATRSAKRIVMTPANPTDEDCNRVNAAMSAGVSAGERDSWLTPIDLITVRAAARLPQGASLLDYQLLDECLSQWDGVTPHQPSASHLMSHTRGIMMGVRGEGHLSGYTGVRPRLPMENLTDIMPSEWGLLRRDKRLGFDKIVNRNTLVYSREGLRDRAPRARILLVFIVDSDPMMYGTGMPATPAALAEREKRRSTACSAKALVYRMALDVAEQTPFELMSIHAAVCLLSTGSTVAPKVCAFDLAELSPDVCQWALTRYDELVDSFFCCDELAGRRMGFSTNTLFSVCDDPFTLMNEAGARASDYTAVLYVLCADSHRWATLMSSGRTELRSASASRTPALLIETLGGERSRRCRWLSFRSITRAASGYMMAFRSGSDVSVRNQLLDMLLGRYCSAPIRVAADFDSLP